MDGCRRRSYFFFQAEDGIRDGHVTGVQTCALPISSPLGAWTGTGFEPQTQTGHARGLARRDQGRHLYRQRSMARFSQEKRVESPAPAVRSEERRVGKE